MTAQASLRRPKVRGWHGWPFDPWPELRHSIALGALATCAVYLGMVVLAVATQLVTASAGLPQFLDERWAKAAYMGVLALSPLAALIGWGLARRRLGRALRVLDWASMSSFALEREVLGEIVGAMSSDDIARRLEGRRDAPARLILALSFAHAGRLDESRATIDHWSPASVVEEAQRRWAMLQLLGPADPEPNLDDAWGAALLIEDPAGRGERLAWLHIEVARREAAKGGEWIEPLVAAADALGANLTTFEGPGPWNGYVRLGVGMLVVSSIPSIATSLLFLAVGSITW